MFRFLSQSFGERLDSIGLWSCPGKKQCTVVYTAVLLAPGLAAIHFAFLQCFHCTLGLGNYFKRLSGFLWCDSIGAFSAHLGSGMGLRCDQQKLSDQLVVFDHKSVSLGN